MKKGNFEQTDLLDTLRYLNSKNINESKELKDNFFDSLIQNYENLPHHIKELSKAWIEGFKKQYSGLARNWLLSNTYVFQIAYQLTDMMIKDEYDCLYLDERNAHYTLTYLASIQGEKELVEEEPLVFESFKQYFLLGLITRYARYALTRNEYKNRFEKLVNIYVEQQLQRKYNVEPQEQLTQYIDEEFISETKEIIKTGLNTHTMEIVLLHLFERKALPYKRKTTEELIEEYKKKLKKCNTPEEKNEIYKILNELYRDSYYEYYETRRIK